LTMALSCTQTAVLTESVSRQAREPAAVTVKNCMCQAAAAAKLATGCAW